FVIIGISGVYSVDFLTDSTTLDATFDWLIIPVVSLSIFFAYHGTFGYKKEIPVWKNLIGMGALTFVFSMITFISFQVYLIRINCKLGEHKDYLLEGQITKLNYPENKKIGNKYRIEILRAKEMDTVELSVPTNEYFTGQKFRKMMKLGSLGFIYSEK
ncbi:hypothetical protein, partial [Xanthovirga aplysinae]|uniref:hypothetical protein n=1 Tax=Xanthovirga aplysinae TaxID=2529853 RepID=UPI001657658D